jgi:hypothetical protein
MVINPLVCGARLEEESNLLYVEIVGVSATHYKEFANK